MAESIIRLNESKSWYTMEYIYSNAPQAYGSTEGWLSQTLLGLNDLLHVQFDV